MATLRGTPGPNQEKIHITKWAGNLLWLNLITFSRCKLLHLLFVQDQVELDPENLLSSRQEPKRSPFFLPKFGSSGKTVSFFFHISSWVCFVVATSNSRVQYCLIMVIEPSGMQFSLKSYTLFENTSMISEQNCTTRSSITTLLHSFWNRKIPSLRYKMS